MDAATIPLIQKRAAALRIAPEKVGTTNALMKRLENPWPLSGLERLQLASAYLDPKATTAQPAILAGISLRGVCDS